MAKGKMAATDLQKAAYESVGGLAKHLITMSTAVLTVSIAFLRDIATASDLAAYLLGGGWLLQLASLGLGTLALMELSENLVTSVPDLVEEPTTRNVLRPLRGQIVTLLCGLVLVASAIIVAPPKNPKPAGDASANPSLQRTTTGHSPGCRR